MLRILSKLLAAGIMAVAAIATSLPLGATVLAKAPVTIEFWHSEVEQERQRVIGELIKKFEQENPGITVKVLAIEENDLRTKLTTAVAVRKLPNVISSSSEMTLRMGDANLLNTQAANGLIDEMGLSNFYQGGLKMVSNPKGGYYAVPYTGWVQGIWYRKDWFTQKGLEPPTTWDAILEAAKTFNDADNRVYGIIIGTSRDLYAEQVFTQIALSNGAHLFSDSGKVDFNTPEMVEALRFYRELAKYTPPGPETWRDARDLYLNGTVAMMFYSTFIMDDIGIGRTGFKGAIVPNLVDKTGFAPYVGHTAKASFGAVSSYGITSSSTPEQVEAAKKFIRFLMRKDNYIKFMHVSPGGFNPMLKQVAASAEFVDEPILKTWGQTYSTIASGLDSIETFGTRDGRVFPSYGNISAQLIIGEALNNMTERDWTPEQTAQWAQNRMEQAVK